MIENCINYRWNEQQLHLTCLTKCLKNFNQLLCRFTENHQSIHSRILNVLFRVLFRIQYRTIESTNWRILHSKTICFEPPGFLFNIELEFWSFNSYNLCVINYESPQFWVAKFWRMNFKCNERLSQLAVGKVRKSSELIEFNPDAYNVSLTNNIAIIFYIS